MELKRKPGWYPAFGALEVLLLPASEGLMVPGRAVRGVFPSRVRGASPFRAHCLCTIAPSHWISPRSFLRDAVSSAFPPGEAGSAFPMGCFCGLSRRVSA